MTSRVTPTDDPERGAKRARWNELRRANPGIAADSVTAMVEREFAGPDFSDVTGGASAPPKQPNAVDVAMERAPIIGGPLAMLHAASGVAPSDVAREIVQGFTGNFADEAGLTNRDEVNRFRNEHPLYATGINAAGMAANPVSQMAFPSKASSILSRIASSAGTGAAIGGIASAGNGEGSLADRLPDATHGAVAGGVIGGALPIAAEIPGIVKGMAGQTILRLLGVPRGATQAASILRRLLSEGGEAAATAAPSAPEPPVDLPWPQPKASTPPTAADRDMMQAIGDYEAGKISGEDLRTALDFARGRTLSEPPPPVSRATGPRPGMSPSELVDQLPPEMQTGRGGPGPRQAPVPTLSPSEAVDRLPPEMQTSRGTGPKPAAILADGPLDLQAIAKKTGAKVVTPGPYQRAAPATRMESGAEPSRNVLALLKQIEAGDIAGVRSQLELARAMGTGPNEYEMRMLAEEMAKRGVNLPEPPTAPAPKAISKAPPRQPSGERDLTVTVPKTRPRKELAQLSDDDLILWLRDSDNVLQNPKIGSSLRVFHTPDHVAGVSKAGGGLGAHILEDARARSENIMNELNRRGLTDEQIYDRMDAIAEREAIQQIERGKGAVAPRRNTPLGEGTPFAIGGALLGKSLMSDQKTDVDELAKELARRGVAAKFR